MNPSADLCNKAKESLGNLFGDAAREAGMAARLHGLRKAFCIYWAENDATTHQIAAMAGHMSLSEVERYTRAADRERMVKLLVGVA
ncbi:tyrosine-type recombinase/integrase [Leisingera sp. HS039]|nr:tyrosine-type recombinase/integrase [Leisingera sp. NJS201]MBQ4823362.1 tyrosine-type recombinase/integrase [Leisingera sp. HS039]